MPALALALQAFAFEQNTVAGVKTMRDVVQEIYDKAIAEGIAEGMERGIAEERARVSREWAETKFIIAKMMIDDQLPPENISRYLAMPLVEVNSIASSMGK